MVIYGNGRIGPPEEGLGQRSPVVQLTRDLDIGLIRIEGKPGHLLSAVHLIHIPHKKRHAPVFSRNDLMIHRTVSGGTMMLRPVKFYTARYPGPGKAYERRLDHPVVIYEIVVIGLIQCPLYASAKLGKDHNLQVSVLKPYRIPHLILFFSADLLGRGIGVDLSRASLIYSFFEKHRILIRLTHLIGGENNLLFPYSDFFQGYDLLSCF